MPSVCILIGSYMNVANKVPSLRASEEKGQLGAFVPENIYEHPFLLLLPLLSNRQKEWRPPTTHEIPQQMVSPMPPGGIRSLRCWGARDPYVKKQSGH